MKKVSGEILLADLGLEFFKGISTLGALSDDSVVYLLNNGEVFKVNKNDCLFRVGDKSDGFYIILKGVVAFYQDHNGKLAFIRNYEKGEHIGVVGMITLQNRVGTGIINEEGLVLKVSTELFYDFYNRNSQDLVLLLMNVIRDMARGLKAVSNIVVDHNDDRNL